MEGCNLDSLGLSKLQKWILLYHTCCIGQSFFKSCPRGHLKVAYTQYWGEDHLNMCTSISTFGIGVVPNKKQTLYFSPMVFATRQHSFESNPLSSFSRTILSKIFSLFWAFAFSLWGFFIGIFLPKLSIVVRMWSKILKDYLVDSSFLSLIS